MTSSPSPTLPPIPDSPPPQQTFPEMLVLLFCHQLISSWKLCGRNVSSSLCHHNCLRNFKYLEIHTYTHMRICQEIWIWGALGASETDEGGLICVHSSWISVLACSQMISFHLHKRLAKQLLLVSFYRLGSWGSERWKKLSRILQLLRLLVMVLSWGHVPPPWRATPFVFSFNCTKLPWILFFLRTCPLYNNNNKKEAVSHASRENKNKQDTVKSLTPDQEAANFFSKYFRLCWVCDLCNTSETLPRWDESSHRQEWNKWKPLKNFSHKNTFYKALFTKAGVNLNLSWGIHTALKNWVAHEDVFPPCRHAMRPCKSMGDHLFRWVRTSDVIYLMRRANSSEKPLMLGKTEGQRRRGR